MIPTTARPTLVATVRAALAMSGVSEIKVVADRNPGQVAAALDGAATADGRLEILAGSGRGPSWARQAGFDGSISDVVLFLDDDVIPTEGLALGHLRHHGRQDGLVVVGYMPVSADVQRRSATACIYSSDYESSCEAYEREPGSVLPMLWGGNVSMRRTDGLTVRQAANAFVHVQHEDREFGLRAARAGLVGVFDRSLLAEHRYERTPAQLLRSSREQAIAQCTLRIAHPGTPPVDYVAGFPRPIATVVRRARPRGIGFGLVRMARRAAVTSSSWAGPRVQRHVIAVARAVEQCAALHEVDDHDVGSPDACVTSPVDVRARS